MSLKKKAPILFMLGALLPVAACESTRVCPPSEPIYKWKEVAKPYPVVLRFEVLPPLELPEYPPEPGPEATEEERKAWSLEVKRVNDERHAMKDARIAALEEREKTLQDLADAETVEPPS